jgi:serine/threonine-protein kinase
MGVVYVAERADIDKVVALKIVRGALAAPELVERFLMERRVLARLEHPNIARLLDAGITDDETPYLVMEYVDGLPITEYCRDRAIGLGERLQLVVDICGAVSYAHGSLVVHRDIKPANVLVTSAGQVKLLDFGIAKLLGEDETEGTGVTRTGSRVLSPQYAAPEQITGEAITTATDVHALGMLLFELLTGERPFRASGPTPRAAERAILDQEPRRPSQVAGTDPSRARRLQGDLDAICLRALEKDPTRRYRSAEQMGQDLSRYLRGLPVAARLPTWQYRAWKFARRHRVGVAAGLGLVLSLAGGLGVSLWQAERADRARQEAEVALARSEAVTDFLTGLFDASDPRQTRGEDITVQNLLDRGVDRIDELEGQPDVQVTVGNVLARVNNELGRYETASRLRARNVAIHRTDRPASDSALVEELNMWGITLYQGGFPDSATAVWEEALDIGAPALGEGHQAVLAAMGNLAAAYGRLGDEPKAEAMFARTIEAEAQTLDPDDALRTYALNNMGLLLSRQERFAEAEPLLREALRIQDRANGRNHPRTITAMTNLGQMLRDAGRYDEAEALLRQGLELRQQVLDADDRFVGESKAALGVLFTDRGNPADLIAADSMLRSALRIYRGSVGERHPAVAYVLHAQGVLAMSRGELAEAERGLRASLDLRRELELTAPRETIESMTQLAAVLRLSGKGEAEQVAREALIMAEELANRDALWGRAALQVALAAEAGRRGGSAAGGERELMEEAVGVIAGQLGREHPDARAACAEAGQSGVEVAACR